MATLGIDLHALSRAELLRLLDATRSRGDLALTNQLMAEIAARRAEERELADEEGGAPARGVRWLGLAAGMTAAVLVSFGLGWWLHKPQAPAAPMPIAVAPAPPPVRPALVQPAPVQPAVAGTPLPVVRLRPPAHSAAAATASAAQRLDCDVARGRVDRMVCADRGLSLRHRQMRAAYDRAVDVGVNRLQLDRDQAKWRKARAQAASPRALAALYDRRIRALQAAVAARTHHRRR